MFRLTAGDRRVAAGLLPLLRDGPRRVLRHRLLLQSPPLNKTSEISKLYRVTHQNLQKPPRDNYLGGFAILPWQ